MLKEKIETERILCEYGRRMFYSHVRFFNDDREPESVAIYQSSHIKTLSRTARRAFILCAILVLIMSLALLVCSALELQIFNYKFDFRNGFIVVTNLNEENGSHFYKPEYIVDNYYLEEIVPLGDSTRYYIYSANNSELEYTIEESWSKEDIVYIDNENYNVDKEVYNGYELLIYKDQTSNRIITYIEKDDTYIAINGHLSIDDIHSIIDSFNVDP